MKPEDLRRRREALGLSQEQLARVLQVSAMTVSRWERGVNPIPPLLPLALEALEARRRKEAA